MQPCGSVPRKAHLHPNPKHNFTNIDLYGYHGNHALRLYVTGIGDGLTPGVSDGYFAEDTEDSTGSFPSLHAIHGGRGGGWD
jgi:hypothetical protein